MKEIIMEVIVSGVYNLADVLRKIDTMWVQSSITDDDRQELIQAAQEHANPSYCYSPLQDQINAAVKRIDKLVSDVSVLRATVEKLGGEVQEPDTPDEWPAWYAWDGVGLSPWQKDSKCTHNGKKWVSQVKDNVWEPGALGVNETIWKEWKEAE